MSRRIGTTAKLNGKTVFWSGDDYGWQTKASYDKLKNEGAFKIGAQEVRRIKSSAKNYFDSYAPQALKDFAERYQRGRDWQAENERRGRQKMSEDAIGKLYINAVETSERRDKEQIQGLSDTLNVDPLLIEGGITAAEIAIEGKVGKALMRRTARTGSKTIPGRGSVGAARNPNAGPINPQVEAQPQRSRISASQSKAAAKRAENKVTNRAEPKRLSTEDVAPIEQVRPGRIDDLDQSRSRRYDRRQRILKDRKLEAKLDKGHKDPDWWKDSYVDPDGATTYSQLKSELYNLENFKQVNLTDTQVKGRIRALKDTMSRLESANKKRHGITPDEAKSQELADNVKSETERKQLRKERGDRVRAAAQAKRERTQASVQRRSKQRSNDDVQRTKELPGQDPVNLKTDNKRIEDGDVPYYDPDTFEITEPPARDLTRKELQVQHAIHQQDMMVRYNKRERGIRRAQSRKAEATQGFDDMDVEDRITQQKQFRSSRIKSASDRATSPVKYQKPIDPDSKPNNARYNLKDSPPTRAEQAMWRKWYDKAKEIKADDPSQTINKRWDPTKVGKTQAIKNFIADISAETRAEARATPRRPRKGDIGRPQSSKLRDRETGETLLADGNSKRAKGERYQMDDEIIDDPSEITIARGNRTEREAKSIRKSMRRRRSTERYEAELTMDTDDMVERNRRYSAEYGDDNRLKGGKLKTDNKAGKESVRQQFRDARERRGRGDTRYRPRKDDKIRKKMSGKASRLQEAALRIISRYGSRPTPGRFSTTNGVVQRSVPTAPTVLDRGLGLSQKRPGQRVRSRVQSRSRR